MEFDLNNPTRLETKENHNAGDPRIVFMIKLGQALHRYGVPAHRLEQGLNLVAQRFGMSGNFFVTPTGIFAAFGLPEEYRTSLIRIESTDVNLEKQAQLDELVTRVIRGQVSFIEGSQAIDRIVAAPSRYGPVLSTICFALASGAAARFCCNLYSRLLNRPAAIPMVPGMMLLVPGSLGFSSLAKFIEKDVVSGVTTAFNMLLIAVALVTGLLIANVIVPPRKTL